MRRDPALFRKKGIERLQGFSWPHWYQYNGYQPGDNVKYADSGVTNVNAWWLSFAWVEGCFLSSCRKKNGRLRESSGAGGGARIHANAP
jgi:hypothetical protein